MSWPVVLSWGIDCIFASPFVPLSGRGFPGVPRATRAPIEAARPIAQATRLIHFVAAEYPKDKHDAGITARVAAFHRGGGDGKVAASRFWKAAVPISTAPQWPAGPQFVSPRREASGTGHPREDHVPATDFTIVTKMVSLGPQVNFEGVILDRFKKQPLADVTVRIKDLDLATKTMRLEPSSSPICRLHVQGRNSPPAPGHCVDRRNHSAGPEAAP